MSFWSKFVCGSKPNKPVQKGSAISSKSGRLKNYQPESYTCPRCAKKCDSKDSLKIHRDVYCHEGTPAPIPERASKTSLEKPKSQVVEKRSSIEEKPNSSKKLNSTVTSINGQNSTITEKTDISKATTNDKTNTTSSRGYDTNHSMMQSRAESVASGKTSDEDQAINLAKRLKNIKVEFRRQKELEYIQQFINAPSPVKYIVSEEWIENYTRFLNGEIKEEPGPIDNKEIQHKIRTNTFSENIYAVHPRIWNFVHSMYTGGPEITQNLNKVSLTCVEDTNETQKTMDTKSTDMTSKGDSTEQEKIPSDPVLLQSQKLPGRQILPTGLQNDMFYCYQNSALQCLMGVGQLVKYTYDEGFRNHLNTGNPKFWKAFDEIVYQSVKKKGQCINPKLIKKMSSTYFEPDEQHDAHEFLRYLLSGMQDEINPKQKGKATDFKNAEQAWAYYKKYNHSVVDELFAGQLQTSIICKNCQHVARSYDPFLDLSLPIQPGKTKNLDDCLSLFLKEEEIKDSYKCEKCSRKKKIIMKTTITKYPQMLFIHLKRFQTFPRRQKIYDNVSYPYETMKLKNVLTNENFLYGLKGIIIHQGSVNGGHYYAYTRRGQDWYGCNDEVCKKVSIKEIAHREAYILLYERED